VTDEEVDPLLLPTHAPSILPSALGRILVVLLLPALLHTQARPVRGN